jgi:hypothetical protein
MERITAQYRLGQTALNVFPYVLAGASTSLAITDWTCHLLELPCRFSRKPTASDVTQFHSVFWNKRIRLRVKGIYVQTAKGVRSLG